MRTVFAALNAKYIHTNLAVRSIRAYALENGVEGIEIWERTVNHRYRQLLRELAAFGADVTVFSIYIWNVELARLLAADLRKIRSDTLIVAAGPEVSYGADAFLEANPAFDFAMAGEGEQTTTALLGELAAEIGAGRRPRQLCCRVPAVFDRRQPGAKPQTPPPLDLDKLPFPYEGENLAQLGSTRILYYESMRGCPYSCGYCLSSVEEGVRLRSLPLVYADLDCFLAAKVRQVKFTDRTFNCYRKRALDVWRYLKARDNGVTNFHFELSGDLLDEESIEFLATVRPGQFQFEIGLQSANAETLRAIRRVSDPGRLLQKVERLREPRNIHLHLDLIAGLPHEDLESFARSFNLLYRYRPDQLQLGFLKVLRGAAMERDAEKYGIRYQTASPYEALSTNWLDFGELSALHGVADMVELYYNSGRFAHFVGAICGEFDSPFDFYRQLAEYFIRRGCEEAPPSKIGYYELLGDFLTDTGRELTDRHKWLCKYDMALHEKPKKLPAWLDVDMTGPYRREILVFLSEQANIKQYLPGYLGREPKYIMKVAHLEVFPFDPRSGKEKPTLLLFRYDERDAFGRAITRRIPLN